MKIKLTLLILILIILPISFSFSKNGFNLFFKTGIGGMFDSDYEYRNAQLKLIIFGLELNYFWGNENAENLIIYTGPTINLEFDYNIYNKNNYDFNDNLISKEYHKSLYFSTFFTWRIYIIGKDIAYFAGFGGFLNKQIYSDTNSANIENIYKNLLYGNRIELFGFSGTNKKRLDMNWIFILGIDIPYNHEFPYILFEGGLGFAL